jgi:hypothetical protein
MGSVDCEPVSALFSLFSWENTGNIYKMSQATRLVFAALSKSYVACRFIHSFGDVPSASARSSAAAAVCRAGSDRENPDYHNNLSTGYTADPIEYKQVRIKSLNLNE